jgi:DNA repair exonuclease SbcCD ATPase subunit
MNNLAEASINTLRTSTEGGFETIEIPISEIDHVFKDSIDLYNQLIEVCKETGILRGRDLARLVDGHQRALQAEKNPIARLLLANALIRQLIARIKKALQTMKPSKREVVRQAITKIQLRAEAIVDHIKVLAEGKEKISLSSPQARQYLAGMEGKPISRRDCIRALQRAEKLCPVLECGHLGDGRQTTRLIAIVEDLVSFGNGLPTGYS